MSVKKIRVATRPSILAYSQSLQVVKELQEKHQDVSFEIVKFNTQGDREQYRSLTEFGNTGLFVKELETALLEKKADIAIHSLKDVPTFQPSGLSLISFPKREDARDVFLSRDGISIEQMPQNFSLGTGSPRRQLQLANIRKDIDFKPIRGNIDTRIRKLMSGEYDAIVLAVAGMNRLSKTFNHNLILDEDRCIPAIGQGALAIECRSNDAFAIELAQTINHLPSMQAVLAERAFMKEIQGACKFPLAAYATVTDETLSMTALIGDLNTNRFLIRKMETGIYESINAAKKLAQQMKDTCKLQEINYYI